jgi:hypothetical protein
MKKQPLRALLPLLLPPLMLVIALLGGCDLFGGSGSGPAGPSTAPTQAALRPGETPGVLTSENTHADEAMEALPIEGVPAATETEGGKPLAYTMDGDVKVFNLTAKEEL